MIFHSGCVNSVKKALEKVSNVENVSVVLQPQKVATFNVKAGSNVEETTKQAIAAISGAGFEPQLIK